MTQVIIMYLAILLATTTWAIVFTPTKGWRKWSICFCVLLLASLSLWCGTSSLGHPKPNWLLFGNDKIKVVQIIYRENVAIYLFGYTDGSAEPVYIVLPWSKQTAEAFAKAQEDQRSDGTDIEYKPDDGSVKSTVHPDVPKE